MISKRKTRLLATAIVLAVFVAYFFLNEEEFKPLFKINFLYILPVFFLYLISMTSNGLFTKVILKPFGKHIGWLESFYVSLISSVGNFFAPVGAGFGFRAVYLKQKHNFSYTHYLSTLAGNYIIVFLVNSIFGLVALYLLRSEENSQYATLLVIFAMLFIVCLLLILLRIPTHQIKAATKNKFLKSIMSTLYKITQGWSFIVSHRKLMLQLVGLSTFNFLIMLLIYWTIIMSLHFHISFAPLILFSVLGSLSLFINITPANLGIKEAIYLFSASVLGFSTSQILSIALIDRGVLFIVLATMWLFSSKYGKQRLSPTATDT